MGDLSTTLRGESGETEARSGDKQGDSKGKVTEEG